MENKKGSKMVVFIIVGVLLFILLGMQVFASVKGYGNVFFMVRDFTKSSTANGAEEIFYDNNNLSVDNVIDTNNEKNIPDVKKNVDSNTNENNNDYFYVRGFNDNNVNGVWKPENGEIVVTITDDEKADISNIEIMNYKTKKEIKADFKWEDGEIHFEDSEGKNYVGSFCEMEDDIIFTININGKEYNCTRNFENDEYFYVRGFNDNNVNGVWKPENGEIVVTITDDEKADISNIEIMNYKTKKEIKADFEWEDGEIHFEDSEGNKYVGSFCELENNITFTITIDGDEFVCTR